MTSWLRGLNGLRGTVLLLFSLRVSHVLADRWQRALGHLGPELRFWDT